jgi:sporulation protein YlmC with PRC-barrel domain
VRRLGELLGCKVVTESGERVGRVHDLQGELVGGRLRITGLVAGTAGVLERYGVGATAGSGARRAKQHAHDAIPWERVVRVGREIVVRD